MPSEGDTASGESSPKTSECRSPSKEELMTEAVDAEHLKALRDSWKFPAVVSFCRVFEDPLKLRQFSSEKLESALVRPEEHLVFLSELVYKLMTVDRKQQFSPDTASEKWHSLLNDKMRRGWAQHTVLPNPLQGQGFNAVSPTSRLEVLHFLTEKLLKESGTIKEVIKHTVDDPGLTADTLRSSPIGEDSLGRKYYRFAGKFEDCRLYREEFPRKKASRKSKAGGGEDVEPVWSTFCTTAQEIKEFVKSLNPTRSNAERHLERVLSKQVLPGLAKSEKNRRKAEERFAALEAAPRKRSTRIQELTKRKEEEEELQRRNEGENAGTDELGGARDAEVKTRVRQDNEMFAHLESRRVAMGPSREERMRLRNERKERQLRGEPVFENGPVGMKRSRYHTYGWTPLGPDVTCHKRKRVQRTKAPKDCRKLEEMMMEEFGRVDHLKTEFDRLINDPKEARKLMSLVGPAPYQKTLAARRQGAQTRMQGPDQSMAFQQQMLYSRQRQYQPRQPQQQYVSQRGNPHHPMASPPRPMNSPPLPPHVFQQQLQQCFNRLSEDQKQTVMQMPSSQRNQVLSQLLRKEMQRVQQVQQRQHVQLQNVAGLRRAPPNHSSVHNEAIGRAPEDALFQSFHHRGQTLGGDSRIQLGYLSGGNQISLKQDGVGGVGVAGRIVQSQMGGLPMNAATFTSPVRSLSSINQRVAMQPGYIVGGHNAGTQLGMSSTPSQSIHSNGSGAIRQAHPSQLLRLPGGGPQSLVGMLVPVSSAPPRNAPQSNGNASGSGQSGQRIVNV